MELSLSQQKAHISDIPTVILQTKILALFSSKDMFKLRGVCGEWSDSIKIIWCQVVKEEMLEQVHSLDLIYEKETTAKLMEFKVKYLVSYATLMRNYFIHMNFDEIVQDLQNRDSRAIIVITCMIVAPKAIAYPNKVEDITEDHLKQASEYMLTNQFKALFTVMCQMDSIPEISLGQMKLIKGEFIDKVISAQSLENMGNAARLLASWIDGALEFTILKHEVIVLRLKHNKVLSKIRLISTLWPRKKEFIEGAYKLLLFTKQNRKQVGATMNMLTQSNLSDFMNFKDAINRILKKWYEQRIQEETERNKKLRELHESLTLIKIQREEEAFRQAIETQQQQVQEIKTQKEEKNEQSQPSEEQLRQIEEKKAQLEKEMINLRNEIQKTKDLKNEIEQELQINQEQRRIQEESQEPTAQEEEEKASNEQQNRTVTTSLFSSQLLSQILNVGSLFTQTQFLENGEEEEVFVDPQYQRRDFFESCLKRRIFLADRQEKIEKALLNLELISKDVIYCSKQQLEKFKESLQIEGVIQRIYLDIMNDKEEIWFDIYKSITSRIEDIDKVREKHMRIKTKPQKRKMEVEEEQKLDLRTQRMEIIEKSMDQRTKERQVNQKLKRQNSDQEIKYSQYTQQVAQDQHEHQEETKQESNNPYAQLSDVFCSLTAIKFLLEQQCLQHQIQVTSTTTEEPVAQDMAIQTEEVPQELQNESNLEKNEDEQK